MIFNVNGQLFFENNCAIDCKPALTDIISCVRKHRIGFPVLETRKRSTKTAHECRSEARHQTAYIKNMLFFVYIFHTQRPTIVDAPAAFVLSLTTRSPLWPKQAA